jgi:hypothetical protein
MKVIKGTTNDLIEWVGNYDPVRRSIMKTLIRFLIRHFAKGYHLHKDPIWRERNHPKQLRADEL